MTAKSHFVRFFRDSVQLYAYLDQNTSADAKAEGSVAALERRARKYDDEQWHAGYRSTYVFRWAQRLSYHDILTLTRMPKRIAEAIEEIKGDA